MTDPRIPALTPSQMTRIDQIMTGELGIDVLQLMELAGQAVAAWTRQRLLDADVRGKQILVLAGSGGNGGDGMVAARFLHAWGAGVTVRLSHPSEALRGVVAHQARALLALGLPLVPPPEEDAPVALPDADVIIDGLLGFSLSGPPRGVSARLIAAANAHPAPILAIDLPSGLDGANGEAYDPCIQAVATLTLALPKTGLLVPAARPFIGELALADIGIPAEAYARLGLALPPLFAHEGVRVIGS